VATAMSAPFASIQQRHTQAACSLYLDPGVMFVQRHSTITVNIPWLVHEDFQRSRVDYQLNKRGGGDLADYLVLGQYSFRF
jgi:hypothetical protein